MLYSTCFTNWETGSEKLSGFLKSHSLDLNPCLSDIRIHDSKPPRTPYCLLKSNQVFIHSSRIPPSPLTGEWDGV